MSGSRGSKWCVKLKNMLMIYNIDDFYGSVSGSRLVFGEPPSLRGAAQSSGSRPVFGEPPSLRGAAQSSGSLRGAA